MVNLSSRMALTLKAAFPARLIHLRLLVMLALGCCVLSAGVTAFSQEKKSRSQPRHLALARKRDPPGSVLPSGWAM